MHFFFNMAIGMSRTLCLSLYVLAPLWKIRLQMNDALISFNTELVHIVETLGMFPARMQERGVSFIETSVTTFSIQRTWFIAYKEQTKQGHATPRDEHSRPWWRVEEVAMMV